MKNIKIKRLYKGFINEYTESNANYIKNRF
jgi:hypothetical protein